MTPATVSVEEFEIGRKLANDVAISGFVILAGLCHKFMALKAAHLSAA